MMSRRRILSMAAATLFACSALSSAQAPKKIPRVGYLSIASAQRDREWIDAFRKGLKELGYVEERSIEIETRHADGDLDRLAPLARELANRKVDVFLVYGGPAAVKAAQSAAPKTPVVMTISGDPVKAGIAQSFAHPGGNVTGFSGLNEGILGKRLQMLKEVSPAISKVAVLFNPATPGAFEQFEELKGAASSLGISLVAMHINNSEAAELKRAYATVSQAHPTALLVIADGTTDRARVGAFALEHRLPAIGTVKEWAEAGFFMSYGTSFTDLWRRSAVYVDKILKGAKPGDLPIEQPTKFELVINMKTAMALGIKIPKSILVQADKVIE